MAGAGLQDGKTTGPGDYTNIWAMNVQDAILQDFTVDKCPPGEKPQLYACQRITLRRGSIKNVRASASADHVEGLHVAGVQGLTIEDVEFDANDVMQLFLTVWVDGDDPGAEPDPTNNIVLRRVRMGNLGVNGSNKDALGRPNYWLIHYHENLKNCQNSKLIDVQVRMGGITSPKVTTDYAAARLSLPPGFVCTYDGKPGVLAVPNGVAWPAFPGGSGGGGTTPPVEPPVEPPVTPPVGGDTEARLTKVEKDLADLVKALQAPGVPVNPNVVTSIETSIKKYQESSANVASTDQQLLAEIERLATRPVLPK